LAFIRMVDTTHTHPDIFAFDPSKITLCLPSGIPAKLLEAHLAQNGIDIEATMANHIIAMTSCADDARAYQALMTALREFDGLISSRAIKPENNPYISSKMVDPIVRLSPRQALAAATSRINIECCAGRISAQSVIPYPPGIPIITAGEEITPAIIDEIMSLTTRPLGLENDEISVIINEHA